MVNQDKKPLSSAQSLLWSGQQLSPESPLYNMAFAFRFDGPLDLPRFQKAFNHLHAESDAMRTIFTEVDGQILQAVIEPAEVDLEVVAVKDIDEPLATWLSERTKRQFDLATKAWDSCLVKIADEAHLWFLNQHHLITDAWSISVQYSFLVELYQGAAAGGLNVGRKEGGEKQSTPSLPKFSDYLERESQQQKKLTPAYWTNTKRGGMLDLYGQTNQQLDTSSLRYSRVLGPGRMEKLDALIQLPEVQHWTRDLSIFNVLCTTVLSLLYRVSGQTLLTIGTPAHNRLNKTSQRTPGCFIEVLPLSVTVAEDETFISLLEKVREATNEFLANSRPGVASPELLREVGVILNYIHVTFPELTGEISTTTSWIHPDHADPAHGLRFQVYDFGQNAGLKIDFDANQAALPQGGTYVPDHFLALFDAFLDNPQALIGQTPLLDPAQEFEQQTLPERTTFTSVLDGFRQQAQDKPNAIALDFSEGQMTYRELDEQSDKLASFLQGRNLNGPVALLLPRSPELLVGILGAWKAGLPYLPIPAATPMDRVNVLLEQSEAGFMLSHSSLKDNFSRFSLPMLQLDTDWNLVKAADSDSPLPPTLATDVAYVMFTSGSTGKPKGVVISHGALANYIDFARKEYVETPNPVFPLFTMIGFDLTVTSLFTPLVSGGKLLIYAEPPAGTPDLAIFRVLEDDQCDVIKLTPSHLALLADKDFTNLKIRKMIVGGENFRSSLAHSVKAIFPAGMDIYNEYGPTEATVGCVVHKYTGGQKYPLSLPIGTPIPGAQVFVLDPGGSPVPDGVSGELFLGGAILADGYFRDQQRTAERFIDHPHFPSGKLYATGDLVRRDHSGNLTFLGRSDRQVKWRGFRIELNEVESALATHPDIDNLAVELVDTRVTGLAVTNHYCSKCGLPANYPSAVFDDEGVCQLCLGFQDYQRRVQHYFKTLDDFKNKFSPLPTEKGASYDCIMLLSGGKDSTYALGQLIQMGLKVLAFTLDNGYISQQALDNVQRVAKALGVDCHVATTPAMNAILTDSLHRHCNVCNGCFKTIYTLSTQLALEKNIPYIVTGLSRGQFFETRLTEELFKGSNQQDDDIDQVILEARKIYHRADDAVKQLLDTSVFDDEEVFDRVQFLDFYRYTDVTLAEMLDDLKNRLPWDRPTDTGRSTNCLINQVGIYVHKKEKGYNNYAFPYSWDVRVGHKEREAALEEINEEVDEAEVKRMMQEIGYTNDDESRESLQLVAYYTSSVSIPSEQLRAYLAERLPDYALPGHFVQIDAMPLTENGKVDRKSLLSMTEIRKETALDQFVPVSGEIEEMLATIWSEVLAIDKIGATEKFIDLGGHSLTAIRLASRINEAFDLELPLQVVFSHPTIKLQATFIEETIEGLLAQMEA